MLEDFFKEQALQKNGKLFKEDFLNKYNDEFILITGAGGSIGRKIVKKLLDINFNKIILLDNSELNLFNVINKYKSSKLKYEIGDIRDKKKINFILKKYRPKLVIHTAAYKHVGLLNDKLYELIRTNLEGTKNIFKASIKFKVSDFIFISTDKAVNPINNMGKSKKLAELYLKSYFNQNKINIKILRFGNVINSSGSVIPIFQKNIYENKNIIIRNNLVERYFIYDDVVARCILNLSLDNINKSYLLNMNSPIKILNLAEYLIKKNESKIKIIISDLNKEEKVYEELKTKDEKLTRTKYADCQVIIGVKEVDVTIRKQINAIIFFNKKFNDEGLKDKINALNI